MKKFLLNCSGFFLLIIILSSCLLVYAKNVKKNAYVLARLDKHEILKNNPSPKVVFVGGSNLAFGIDCSQIKDSVGLNCVNMGLHAGQGLRFILDDIDPYIKEMNKDDGNIIVLMPEFAHFFGNTSDGGSTTLGEVIITDPHSLSLMDGDQKMLAFKGVPKLLTGCIMENIILPHRGSGFTYSRNNFDEDGDEISHLKMEYDDARTPIPPHIIINGELNKEFCLYFQNIVSQWREHATVVIFPETIYTGYLEDNEEKLNSLVEEFNHLQIPYYTNLDKFSYSYDIIFKAPDHITGKGVIENSGRVGHLLKQLIENI